jgi:DNA-binding CsgD family transcriptional regulator
MERLSASRLRKVMHAIARAVEFRDLPEFRSGSIALARELVPCESASYNEVRPGVQAIVIADPAAWLTRESVEVFGRLAGENPLIRHYLRTGDGQPLRFSDFLSRRHLHRLALYDELYRLRSVEHQIAFVLPSPPGEIVGIALNRQRPDFTGEEAAMLDLLRAPLRACYSRLVERERLLEQLSAREDGERLSALLSGHGLSERQLEVLRGVRRGASNAEIAVGLGISRRTVEKHLQNAYALLEVTSRTQALARMQAAGRGAPRPAQPASGRQPANG